MYQLRGVSKSFPGVRALSGIDFEVKRGEVVGLVGENGAGKSTLMKVIYGAYQQDEGEILIDGEPVRFRSPREAMEAGVGMVFQEQSLIPNLTIMENIFLGFESQFVRCGVIRLGEMARAAKRQLEKVRLDVDPHAVTSSLSFAQRQLVEFAKVLALEDRIDGDLVILLDEPTSVLSREEVELLFGLVRDLRSRASFIFVSHHLDEVIEISDRIYVLKDGRVSMAVDRDKADVTEVQHAMVGRTIDHTYFREDEQGAFDRSKVLVELDGASSGKGYRDVSLKLHAGEVLALVGVEGSGCEEVLRTLFGMRALTGGTLRVRGGERGALDPVSAIELGIGYVPRERKVEGLVNGMHLYENITLPRLGDFSAGGLLKVGKERSLARDWIGRLSIKASSEHADCGKLSGGNQQKVVLAKWRSADAGIILLDHPTRGLDIGAKEDVYRMVREMSAAGSGIILVADTLDEAIGLSHNAIVMRDGEVRERFACPVGDKPSPYDLIAHMI